MSKKSKKSKEQNKRTMNIEGNTRTQKKSVNSKKINKIKNLIKHETHQHLKSKIQRNLSCLINVKEFGKSKT